MNAAWGFVVANSAVIDRTVGRFWRSHRPPRYDREDFAQDLLVELVRRHNDYDPSRSGASTWIWWQARSLVRRRQKRHALDVRHAEQQMVVIEVLGHDHWRSIIDRIDIDRAIGLATEPQREALECIASDQPVTSLGVTDQAVRNRLRALRRRVDASCSRDIA